LVNLNHLISRIGFLALTFLEFRIKTAQAQVKLGDPDRRCGTLNSSEEVFGRVQGGWFSWLFQR